MSTLPLSEVKARLSEIAEEVATTHERVQMTKNGRHYVGLLAVEDLASIEATLELRSDPDAQSRVARAEEDRARRRPGRGAGSPATRCAAVRTE